LQFAGYGADTNGDGKGKAERLRVECCAVAFDDSNFLQAPDAFGDARRGQSDATRDVLQGGTAIRGERAENFGVDPVQRPVDMANPLQGRSPRAIAFDRKD
jgi:hypothetical protein